MSKVWAVKQGRKPGIYKSWLAAEVQVNGYPNSRHECFKSMAEARVFMGMPPEDIEVKPVEVVKEVKSRAASSPTRILNTDAKFAPSTDPMVLHIYTDGSHQRKLDYLGIGAWCRYQDQVYELSAKVTRDTLESYGIARDAVCSNPTAEFIAFAEVLKRFVALDENRSIIRAADSNLELIRFKGTLKFFLDYNGVEKWMLGKQKAKAPHIIKVRDFCRALIKTMSCTVEYVHVPSHSGVEGNECADKLASNKNEIDSFTDLFKKLPI